MDKKFTDIDLIPLRDVSFKEFEKFTDSLTIERDTWSLELNIRQKNMLPIDRTDNPAKDFYNVSNALLAIVDRKIVGLVQASMKDKFYCLELKETLNIEGGDNKIVEFSFLVHRKYQGRGIGTLLIRKILLHPNNLADMFIARYYTNNIASHLAFKKNGFLVYGTIKDQFLACKKITYPSANDDLTNVQPKIIGDKLSYE